MLLYIHKLKKKLFSNKKYLLGIVLLLLTVPVITEAAIGTGIFDFFTSVLEGVSETKLPFMLFFVFLFLSLLVSKAVLEIAIWFLETAADPARLEIMESEMVQVGWQFTSSLANTAIIIILIIIGIATILNKETLAAKKALPKLIIVALLVNFSLVFVGAVVDVANIILMTFFEGGIGSQITGALTDSWGEIITSMFGYLMASFTAFAIPFSAPFAQIGFVMGMTGAFLPQLLSSIMQIIATSLVAGTLFIYGFLFIARIFVIQILAIASPLAFIAWVIPKTRNLWDRWLKALVGWASIGIVLMFFLLLSTIAVAPLRPEDSLPAFGGHFSGAISSIFIYYFVLCAFLIITAKMAKKFMPEGAQAIIDGGKQALTGLKDVAAPISKPIRRSVNHQSTSDKIEKNKKRLEEGDFDSGIRGKFQEWNTKANVQLGKYTRRSKRSRQGLKRGETKDLIENSTPEELDKMIKGEGLTTGLKDDEKNPAIQKLADTGDFDKFKDTIIENWSNLGKDMQKKLKKQRPDIHMDLADSMEEGMENMIKEIESMKPSDTKDIDLEKINDSYKTTVASVIARDGSAVKSWGSASRNKKEALVHSLEGAGKGTLDTFAEHVKKNKDKWPDSAIKTTKKKKGGDKNNSDEEGDDNESSGGSDFNPNPTPLTDDEKDNFWGNN